MSDKKFNIFQVGGYWEAEEFHTRVIAELINPQSHFHDMGAIFLKKFLYWIGSGLELPDWEIENAEVKTEVPTDTARSSRRIDMVISTKSLYLPFEVKIRAVDQDAQLWDYYNFAKKQAKDQGKEVSAIYYLTPDGHKPSAWSRIDLTDEQIRLLSFKEHIYFWICECTSAPGIPSDVQAIMEQMLDNIRGQPGSRSFSEWTWDVLDIICRKLSETYIIWWTACTRRYKMFTLGEAGELEFDLRIEKMEDSPDKVELYLICCLQQEGQTGEKVDYQSTVVDQYISEYEGTYNDLLNATFQDGGSSLEIKTGPISAKGNWNRLPEKDCYKNLDADSCCREIEKIFDQLKPCPGMVPGEEF